MFYLRASVFQEGRKTLQSYKLILNLQNFSSFFFEVFFSSNSQTKQQLSLPKRRADCHHLVAKLRAFKATAAALFSHRSCFRRTSVPKASAKLRLFFIPSKFFNEKLSKKYVF
jgi:hypothetical protein